MNGYSQGGVVGQGSSFPVQIYPAGDCICGFPLWRIGNSQDRPEHILNDDMVWRWRLGMLKCAANYGGGA